MTGGSVISVARHNPSGQKPAWTKNLLGKTLSDISMLSIMIQVFFLNSNVVTTTLSFGLQS